MRRRELIKPIPVGFAQRIQLEWLDEVARLANEAKPVAETRSAIREVVGQHLSINSAAKKGNSQKATCILMRTWVTVSEKTVALRDRGLRLFETADQADRLALHWGMCMVAYPFFSMVAESTGRLLRLQGSVAQAQILRRVWDQIGERETVTRAAQRVLRTFADWKALEIIEEQGYKSTRARVIKNPDLGGWLIEASLLASGEKYAPLHSLRSSPTLFPFSVESISGGTLARQGRLEILPHALDDELVGLR